MTDEVCLANLGPRGRRQRLVLGVAMGLVAVGGVVFLAVQDLPPATRLLVFVPLFVAGLGIFQATAGT